MDNEQNDLEELESENIKNENGLEELESEEFNKKISNPLEGNPGRR